LAAAFTRDDVPRDISIGHRAQLIRQRHGVQIAARKMPIGRQTDFLAGTAWFLPYRGREQPPIFPSHQRSMKAEERGGLQDDPRTDQPARAHDERTQPGDHAI